MLSKEEMYADLVKLLGKNSDKLDEYIELIKGNPKVKRAWKNKRDNEQFKVSSNNRDPFIIKGWDDLLVFTGKKVATIRVYLSNGGGRFATKGFDPKTGIPEMFTIERVFGSDLSVISSAGVKKMVAKSATPGVIRDADTGEIIDKKGRY